MPLFLFFLFVAQAYGQNHEVCTKLFPQFISNTVTTYIKPSYFFGAAAIFGTIGCSFKLMSRGHEFNEYISTCYRNSPEDEEDKAQHQAFYDTKVLPPISKRKKNIDFYANRFFAAAGITAAVASISWYIKQ